MEKQPKAPLPQLPLKHKACFYMAASLLFHTQGQVSVFIQPQSVFFILNITFLPFYPHCWVIVPTSVQHVTQDFLV